MFVTLLNEIFPANRRGPMNKAGLPENEDPEVVNENEWMQEYHIIYNSYILESTEIPQDTE